VRRALPDKLRRHWVEVEPRHQPGAVAVVVEAELAPQCLALTARIKRRILQTTPQPPRSVLAEPAVDERR